MSKKTHKEMEVEAMEVAMDQERQKKESFNFEGFKFETIADFDIYNAEVRKHNRMCVHERQKMRVKVPDETFYKKFKTKFYRFEQPENVLKVRVRNKEIDYTGQLKSGGTYMLPMPVINFLNKLATPEFAEVKTEHGNAVHTETKQVGERPRFSCNIVEYTEAAMAA